MLASPAVDAQVDACFIKGGTASPLSFSDDDGNPRTDVASIVPPTDGEPQPGVIPEPLTSSLGLFARRRR